MISLLRAAVDRGVTFFDTAEVYGPLRERGAAGRGARAVPRHGRHRHEVRLGAGRRRRSARWSRLNSRPEHIKKAVEGSLQRLRVDAIDLYYQHRVDPEVPIEDVAGAVKDLIRAGQGEALRTLRSGGDRPSAAPTPSSRSLPCRASTRSGTASPRRRCCRRSRSSGSASFPSALSGKGFLTGAIDATTTFDSSDFRNTVPRFSAENRKANQALVELLQAIAQAEGSDPRPDRARLAARTEALDRSDPGDDEAASPRREHRRRRRRADGGRSPRDRGRRLEDHHPRRAVSRAARTDEQSLGGLRMAGWVEGRVAQDRRGRRPAHRTVP